VGVLTHLKGIKSAPQHAIPVERACWQGEAVAAVVARSRAEAEDGCENVAVDYEPLAAVTDPETALDPATPVIHPELGDNLCFERVHTAGDPDDRRPRMTRAVDRRPTLRGRARPVSATRDPCDCLGTRCGGGGPAMSRIVNA
jgi:CO/xanthine dehydrogenase Mo-binding subunit